MHSPAPFAYALLQTPADALALWFAENAIGSIEPVDGVVFAISDRDANDYLRAAERVLPPTVKRFRNYAGPVVFEVDNGACIAVEIIRSNWNAWAHAAVRPFLCFDNPAAWADHNTIISLARRLSTPRAKVVAVGSHITWNPDAGPVPKPAVDYGAITRSIAG
jgi:hypothetical protein